MEIGNVSAVMTVLRHELRNRKTMATASAAPSIKVVCTSLSDSTMGFEASLITCRTTFLSLNRVFN
ncbi:hypothetical protein D3C86_2234290 [compost metagenome]